MLRPQRDPGWWSPQPSNWQCWQALPISAPHMTVVQKDAHIIYLTGLCWNVNEHAQRQELKHQLQQ